MEYRGVELLPLRLRQIDAEAGRRDGFASTMWAAAWARQTAAITKDIVTVLTACRVQNESLSLVSSNGFHDVGQMRPDLSLGNPQHLCQLVRRSPGTRDHVDDSLTRRPFGRQHEVTS